MAHEIIREISAVPGLKIQCPECDEETPIEKCMLFNLHDPYPSQVHKILKARKKLAEVFTLELKDRQDKLSKDKKRKPLKIAAAALASNFGQISEQILPAFVTFPYKQGDCRVLLKPIDYVVFQSLCSTGRVELIKFVDVKTGGGSLDKKQKQIRACVRAREVKHRFIPSKK